MQQKLKNWIIVIVLAVIVVVSLYLAYENGVIGKAIVQSVAG
ncbi:MAG: hypothetical protein ABH850_00800 [Candidatus Micrarchaeota archaeon]